MPACAAFARIAPRDREAIHVRHAEVQEDHRGAVAGHGLQRILAAKHGAHVSAQQRQAVAVPALREGDGGSVCAVPRHVRQPADLVARARALNASGLGAYQVTTRVAVGHRSPRVASTPYAAP